MTEPFGCEAAWYESDRLGVGARAFDALEALVIDRPPASSADVSRRAWLPGDYEALFNAVVLEDVAREKGLPSDAPSDTRSQLDQHLATWRMALPFSEAERNILVGVNRGRKLDGEPYGELPTRVGKIEIEVISAGVQTAVRGRDLMRRWWAWRRELDEFKEQGSLDQAKSALIALVDNLVPPDRLPGFYYDLRSQERPVPYHRAG